MRYRNCYFHLNEKKKKINSAEYILKQMHMSFKFDDIGYKPLNFYQLVMIY